MSRKLKIILSVVAVLIVACIVIGVKLSQWMNQSGTGTISVQNPSHTTATVTQAQSVPLTTNYYTTQLPSGFHIDPQAQTLTSPELSEISAAQVSDTDESVGLTIGDMPTTGLKGVADYNMRIMEPSQYVETPELSVPTDATTFKSVDSSSLVVFWPHDSIYAEIACTSDGGATESQLDQLCTGILSKWLWK